MPFLVRFSSLALFYNCFAKKFEKFKFWLKILKNVFQAKMNTVDHHTNLQKGKFLWYFNFFLFFDIIQSSGHLIEDVHHGVGLQGGQMTPIYGAAPLRATSNSSNSPGNLHGQSSTLLVVPQPINATKMTSGLSNGNGRKYQCKMCPQVRFGVLKGIFGVLKRIFKKEKF